MVNGRDAPCNADPQEDVHRVTSGHVPHARVGVLVLACGHLARERVCNKITYLDPDSPPLYLLASLSSPPSHSLSLIPSHQIYRLSIIPRSHEQQYDTVISFILYIYICTSSLYARVGYRGGGLGTCLEARGSKSSGACGAPRFVATPCHVVYTNLQFTIYVLAPPSYKTSVRGSYRGNILINISRNFTKSYGFNHERLIP